VSLQLGHLRARARAQVRQSAGSSERRFVRAQVRQSGGSLARSSQRDQRHSAALTSRANIASAALSRQSFRSLTARAPTQCESARHCMHAYAIGSSYIIIS
jgi:hypothetical protein